MDSVDLMPHLTGKVSTPPHDVLHWRSLGSQGLHALRKGNWKLVKKGSNHSELYDLSTDIAEANDLSSQQPAITAELEAQRQAWSSSMMELISDGGKTAPKAKAPKGKANKAAKVSQ
jgi:arylsulfatase A-like enzyme